MIPGVPRARSVTPSPLTSPIDASGPEKLSPPVGIGPPLRPLEILTKLFNEPLAFINDTYTGPFAPMAKSVTPSPSRSPNDANDAPKKSSFASVGAPFMPSAIFVLLFTEPLAFMNNTYTAPRSCPPVSSEEAPTARSVTPSPSKSPSDAIETPNRSSGLRFGPPFVALAIFAEFFTEPLVFMNSTNTAPLFCAAPVLSP